MKLQISTPIVSLGEFPFVEISSGHATKLASAVAQIAYKTEIGDATVGDLLSYFPARYEDRSNFIGIDQLSPNLEASVELFVRVSGGYRVGRNRSPKAPPLFIFEVNAADAERRMKPVVVSWFVSGRSAPRVIEYYQRRFAMGVRFVAFGKWEWDSRRGTLVLRVNKPDDLEILPPIGEQDKPEGASPGDSDVSLDDDVGNPRLTMVHTGRIVPVYRKLGPFQTKRLREIMYCVTTNLDPASVVDPLPEENRIRRVLVARSEAIARIHFPSDDDRASDYQRFRSAAQRRFIYDEFLWLSCALEIRKKLRIEDEKACRFDIGPEFIARAEKLAPFELTRAQKRVLATVFGEMGSTRPMNRLIQGDVGSGKTIVAFLAMFAAVGNGYQAALMAPTEILAEQHFRNATALFRDQQIEIALLTGSLKAAEKRAVRTRIADGSARIVIGTHAIIQDGVNFARLGLAVIDEQHRFGVLQRAEIRARGLNPDILVMTATPIPRSLAMTVYGELDVSIINELPPGRTAVKTVVVGEDQRNGVYRGMRREIDAGHQVYVVYPLVEESERSDLKAATKMFEELRDRVFPEIRVGLLHGRMKPSEKESVMRDFVAGTIKILVSTTVIEVGVDVPNASLMVIEHAERFGLSQLHQLRGRVGRGAKQSYCVLLADYKRTANAKERLAIMEETADGFKIADKDLEIRGQGEVLGTRQAGIRFLKIADLSRDRAILEDAREDAREIVETSDRAPGAARLRDAIVNDPRFQLGGIL